MAQVLLDRVSKRFHAADNKTSDALRSVSLSIEQGELLVLLGPSGSGKTTLLRILAGLEQPDEGRVMFDGKDAAPIPPEDRDLAMVFQNGALYPHLTTHQNISLGLRLRKLPRSEIEGRVAAVADRLELNNLLNRLPRELSGGERQRVALARALARKPRILLLDEPLSHADAPRRVQLRREIAELHTEFGTTLIHVTHDQEEALSLGKRVAVLRDGTLQQVGPAEELYNRPHNVFVAGFLGAPGMNILRGTLGEDSTGCFLMSPDSAEEKGPKSPLPLAGEVSKKWKVHYQREVLLGIRPERIGLECPAQPKSFPLQVERVESTGANHRVFFRIWRHQMVAVTVTANQINQDNRFGRINVDDCHLFDPASGQRLA